MLEKDEFESWVSASHKLFELFEGRHDAYPLAKKWVQQWLSFSKFDIEKRDIRMIKDLIQDFDFNVFRNFRDRFEQDDDNWTELVNRVDNQFKVFVRDNLQLGKHRNVGLAVALFLFTWNFQRFKEYFKSRGHVNLAHYFKALGEFLENKKSELVATRDKKLIYERIVANEVRKFFRETNAKLKELGIGHNEPVGTAKLLHIFAPFYFPLIDNSEARATGLIGFKESITSGHYINWMTGLREWLQNYQETVEKLEDAHSSSILKLVDEGLYMMSTVKQRSRVAELGIELEAK